VGKALFLLPVGEGIKMSSMACKMKQALQGVYLHLPVLDGIIEIGFIIFPWLLRGAKTRRYEMPENLQPVANTHLVLRIAAFQNAGLFGLLRFPNLHLPDRGDFFAPKPKV
jgi:hypothetical protein